MWLPIVYFQYGGRGSQWVSSRRALLRAPLLFHPGWESKCSQSLHHTSALGCWLQQCFCGRAALSQIASSLPTAAPASLCSCFLPSETSSLSLLMRKTPTPHCVSATVCLLTFFFLKNHIVRCDEVVYLLSMTVICHLTFELDYKGRNLVLFCCLNFAQTKGCSLKCLGSNRLFLLIVAI